MCEIVVINRGEKEIETPNQFNDYFGFFPKKHKEYNDIDLDSCLCQCDLDKTLQEKNIEYAKADGDYYIGNLFDIETYFYFHFKPFLV